MPATPGMKGAGYYDQHSTAQRATIHVLQDWIEAAVANLPLPAPAQRVTVLDLGSSEVGNAIHGMATIVAGLRRRAVQPFQTIYSDLPSNNFNRLFANLEEPVVKAALRQPEREEVIVENLHERIRARLLAEPERFLFRYIVVAVLLTRR
jgi:hypothetical protein